ncbi:hypothetical protein LOZ52_000751 [Ophidiomyces ophidiicola]|nr:hypothetical protein LOZ64_003067 [Ophidiomyces ophidiicola]KAI2003938.1 hypothetical protein LOZ50_004590 [Ophidiomyces ophidiicola]KAI2014000.1 hypothetical protein LOZ49_001640 [Ophidiomyces ophidiicola]KAI2027131.1 hypothetical protein LOZ46_000211 [Ophidiomyces ophidiicola]KAI2036921.1 hypothetical protein LOZ47_004025 [Ophidiomyces ophidiicola]
MPTRSFATIQHLGERIQLLIRLITAEWVAAGGEEQPFESPAWTTLTDQLQDATEELVAEVISPKSYFRNLQLSHYDLVAFQVALEFRLFNHVPLSGEITLKELAQKVGVDQDRVGRVMRLLNVHGVFEETREDVFMHSVISEFIAKDDSAQSAIAIQMDEMYQAASSTAEAIRKSPLEQKSDITPFSTRFGTSIYEFYTKNSDKADRFGRAMRGASGLDEESMISLRECYDWAAMGSGKIVDVGGGAGHVSKLLSQHFPNLSFVVQDIFPPPSLGPDNKIAENVQFHQHDFFQPQPVTDAEAYFMKHALHNHSDADCIKIIRALVPALEKAGKGTPLLLNEGIIPALGHKTPRHQDLAIRRGDMCMMVTLSARERTAKQFGELLKAADPRLNVTKIHGGAVTKLIEVHLANAEEAPANGIAPIDV